ncbi:MAG: phospho-N-acetylmuramoyl-pentapeptide-transferase [Oscillospiraceae bacterium]|jgi:phospho-N-acetylmuramoyl-pentapeptide-transferase|nr:phospho-N-acetylmuramoyl-pentapeptide-transferase [Oscillospiraceae bacterium]
MNGIWTVVAAIISFAITAILGKFMIPFLHKLKYGQTILEIGPVWHNKKQGTPTMGGIMFIIGTVLSAVICIPLYYIISGLAGKQTIETAVMTTKIFAGLCMAILFGAAGFLDDYTKVIKKQNKGLSPRQKLILQFAIAIAYLLCIYIVESRNGGKNITSVSFPFLGSLNFGFFYWIISAVVIVGIVNAVNLNDGIDGLTSSVTFFASIFYMVISSLLGMFGLSILSAALAGGCLGFLIWNFYPAKVFMGDTGSLFLGGMICALGFGTNLHIVLILISFVYILEMFSVILQVLYFKYTHGKRLFKMSPIHHHFEMIGWSETKICTVFSLAVIFFGVISFIFSIYAF